MKNCTYVLRASLCLCMFLLAGRLSAQTTAPFTHQGITASTGDFLGFLQYKPADYDLHPNTKYPIIIFLHGIGERGNGTTELDKVAYVGMPRIIYKGNKMKFTWNGKTETFLVLAPQCPLKYPMWPAAFVNDLIAYAKQNLRIDTNRMFLTGLSMGGGGSLRYISDALPDNAKRIAAVATCSAPCTFRTGQYAAAAHLPVWCFHAEDDPTASVQCTKNAINGLNQWSPNPKPLLDLWPTGGHVVWDRVYTDTNYQYQGVLNIYEWFLGQNKTLPVNVLPRAKAVDAATTTGTGTVTLDASPSTDADGRLVRYVWKKISGPAAGVITTKMGASPTTTVTGLTTAGTYKYAVFVVDDRASFTSDTITVTVTAGGQQVPPPPANVLPAAKAGSDIVITLPTNNTTLNGSASSDADGTISSYTWTRISGPTQYLLGNSSAASTSVSNLAQGIYAFKLTVTDNNGGKDADTIVVKVNAALPPPNVLPVANAGNDITITLPANNTTLNGSASSDADGTVSSYAWVKISGPTRYLLGTSVAASTSLSNLMQGTYAFKLTVTDNQGGKDADTIVVKVNAAPPPPPNILPVARAGSDVTITLPLNKVTLNANGSTDADGTINSYSWARISGPAQFSIANPNAPTTQVTNLTEGTYAFRVLVTDNRGGTDTDTILVTVNPAPPPPNVPPVADAGANQTITLPASTVSLSGESSSDADGTIVEYAWTKISGPAGGNITTQGSVGTTVTGLQEGTYSFRLAIKDNDGAADADTVNVTVNAAAVPPPPPNIAPVAKAGNNITITLPVNSATVNGSASTDADGTITNYSWSKISGPGQFKIVSLNSSVTEIQDLVEGTYSFRLQVKDNDGAISRDTVTVTIKPSPNTAPIADAGQDFVVNLPDPVIRLNGLGSSDPDGTVASYNWTKVSGPGGITITNSTTATPGVAGVVIGEYIFRLTVTDNTGATAFDDVKVTVLAEGDAPAPPEAYNFAPIANAGPDQTVGIPETTAVLDASASHDDDGSIDTYGWKQISGPSTAIFDNAAAISTGISGLQAGDYVFELTVTDNFGASGQDTVTISVTNNLRFEQQMSLYPNPAKSNLMVQMTSDTTGQAKISVYNTAGILVKSFSALKGPGQFRNNLNVSDLQAGLYYVEVVIGQKQKMISKFIKK